jgi:hypothetical protein
LISFTLDTTVAAPVIALVEDTGTSATDRITRNGALRVVTAEAGATVEYEVVSGGVTTWVNQATTPYAARSGANSVRFRQTDLAGNVSTVTTFTFTLDTAAPVAPVVRLTSDTGTSATDRITRVGTLTGGESGARFEYSANGTTGWSSVFAPVEGVNSTYVRQIDVAGNVSPATATPFTFTLDTIAPTTAPTGVSLVSDTGIAGDLRTTDTRLAVTGLDAGARAEYQVNSATTWSPTFTPVPGLNTVKVRQADAAGNPSSGFTTFTFTYAAQVTAITLPAAGTYAVGSKITVKVKYSEAVFLGGTGANPYMVLRLSSTVTRNAVYESGSGTDELVFSYTVASGDVSAGITFPTSIVLPTGRTLRDDAGNNAGLTGRLPSPLPSVKI